MICLLNCTYNYVGEYIKSLYTQQNSYISLIDSTRVWFFHIIIILNTTHSDMCKLPYPTLATPTNQLYINFTTKVILQLH